MVWVLVKGALGCSLVLLLWVAIERAWSRSVGPLVAAAAQRGNCRGCLVCARRCEGEPTRGRGERNHTQGGSSWS